MKSSVHERTQHEIDAANKVVGRVASHVVKLLIGKNKPDYLANIDNGDRVLVLNASKVTFTGRKFVQKDYYRHTMHPGGIRRTALQTLFEKDPAEVLRKAIYGMLPKNKHREERMKRLTIKA